MGVFEDFVNANLPLRVVEYNPLNSGYDFDPNNTGALTQIKNAPVGALYYNSTGSLYIKRTTSSGSWVLIATSAGGAGGGGGAGEVSASYLVLSTTSSLINERVLSVGTGLTSSDGGANGNFHITAPFVSASYLTINSESNLPNERRFVLGTGLSSSDGGSNGNFTVSVRDNIFATISGALFTGRVYASGGLTGSLQEVSPGVPYIVAGPNITTVTNSNGSIEISGSANNFSYKNVISGSTTTVPINQQMIYNGDLVVDGDLIVDGEIVQNNDLMYALALIVSGGKVDISASAPPVAGYALIATSPTTAVWAAISGSGGGGSGGAGEVSASYLVLSTTSSLANERVLTIGAGLSSSDGGANGNFTISAPFVSASYLTINSETNLPNERVLTIGAGLSSSDGGANGNFTISAPFVSASYLTINSEPPLPNERNFTVGTGLSSSDGGANGSFTVTIRDSILATLSGSRFTGRLWASGGLTGSLQEVSPGIPYIVAGPNITLVTNSNGSIAITGSSGNAGEVSASYLVLSTTSSLANERVLSVGTGLSSSDGGANGNFHVTAPFVSASYLTINSETTLPNERVFTVGTGLSSSDGGANGNLTVSINNTVVSTLSGSRFTGRLWASGGLTGSLQEVSPGIPYIVAGPNITLVTNSNGSIAITGSIGTGEVSASYLVLSTTSSLANERVLSVGTGLSSSDGGANGNFHITAPFVSASYLTINSETTLPNERVFTIGTGLSSSDGGANGNFIISSPDNFSYKTIPTGSTITIPVNQQMLHTGDLTIDGTLFINGEVSQVVDSFIAVSLAVSGSDVDISASAPPVAGYALIATNTTTAEWSAITKGGTSGSRPITPVQYTNYFDTTLGIPVWYSGSVWVNANGAIV
jgi:hypothetical protein